jgi:hypothetical protein
MSGVSKSCVPAATASKSRRRIEIVRTCPVTSQPGTSFTASSLGVDSTSTLTWKSCASAAVDAPRPRPIPIVGNLVGIQIVNVHALRPKPEDIVNFLSAEPFFVGMLPTLNRQSWTTLKYCRLRATDTRTQSPFFAMPCTSTPQLSQRTSHPAMTSEDEKKKLVSCSCDEACLARCSLST